MLEYVTGRELHPQPADPRRDEHFHCFFAFGKKVHLTNRRTSQVFDLPGRGGRRLHPEIQSVGNLPGDRQRVIEYDMKDGDWRGELREQLVRDKPLRQPVGSDDDGSVDDEPEKGGAPTWARRLQQAANVRVGMQRLFEESPHIYFTQGSRIEQMLMQDLGSPTRVGSHTRRLAHAVGSHTQSARTRMQSARTRRHRRMQIQGTREHEREHVTCASTRTHTYARTHIHTCFRIQTTRTRTRAGTCAHAHTHVHANTHTRTQRTREHERA